MWVFSQFIRVSRASGCAGDFKTRSRLLTAGVLGQCCRTLIIRIKKEWLCKTVLLQNFACKLLFFFLIFHLFVDSGRLCFVILAFPGYRHLHRENIYIEKLGFIGVYIIFSYFCSKNIDCGYSLEPPRRGGSNEYPQSMFWAEIWKISDFCLKTFSFGGEI